MRIPRMLTLALSFMLGTALAAAPALAAKPTFGLEPVPSAEAADDTLGMALMGAVVKNDGNLLQGWQSGVLLANRMQAGVYEIYFYRNIEGCPPAVTTILPGGIVQMGGGMDNMLTVAVTDAAGTLIDATFSILVFCAK